MQALDIAAIQMRADDDHPRCMATATAACRTALAAGATWVVLPENYSGIAAAAVRRSWALHGDPCEASAVAPLLRLTQDYPGACIVAGGTPELADDGRVYNTALVLQVGRVLARYRKLHLFDADPPGQPPLRESDGTAAGDRAVAVRSREAVVGLSICYDLRFAELYASLAAAGAEVLLVPAAFTHPTGLAHWEVLLRARAIETQCFVVAAAQWGEHGAGRRSFGHSMIVDPWGRVLAQQREGDAIVQARLEPAALLDARARIPVAHHRVAHDRLRVALVDATDGD
jgi:predicted amidohydrolase